MGSGVTFEYLNMCGYQTFLSGGGGGGGGGFICWRKLVWKGGGEFSDDGARHEQ